MLNRWEGIGNLTADPDSKFTPNGVQVTTFTVAVNRPFKNDEGEREADYVPVVCWRKLAEITANNLEKGRKVYIEGRLQFRSYEVDGSKRKAAEVIAENVEFLDKREQIAKNTPPPF